MSLLMDALRKAELEKKQAAKRLEQPVAQERKQGDADAVKSSQPGSVGDNTSEQPITRLDPTLVRSKEEIFAATAEISLEPFETPGASDTVEQNIITETPEGSDTVEQNIITHGLSEDVTMNVLIDQISVDQADDKIADDAVTQLELTSAATAIEEDLAAGADSPHDGPSQVAADDVNQQPQGIYDETIEERSYSTSATERSYEETLPGVSAMELARDLGEENQPTPVAAQTVFTATATTKSSKGFKWPVIIGLSFVMVIAVSIFAYRVVTIRVTEIPSQQLARELELLQSPVTGESTLLSSPVSGPLLSQESEAKAALLVLEKQVADVATEELLISTESIETESVANRIGAEGADVSLGSDQPEDGLISMADDPENTGPPVMSASIDIEPSLIKISRSKIPDEQGRMINDAYTAYKNGDFSDARNKYAEVLKIFPDNRDALLGLGALAMNEGNAVRIYDIYSHLFKINPRDSVARAVLVNLNNPVNRESTLKIMINNDPEEAFLYFSLGNSYAAQSRWAEAQQAFFDAYSKDSSNPDYAVNLAISLDQMGQAETALDYYNTALKLADEQSAGFDSANILARIQTLSSVNNN